MTWWRAFRGPLLIAAIYFLPWIAFRINDDKLGAIIYSLVWTLCCFAIVLVVYSRMRRFMRRVDDYHDAANAALQAGDEVGHARIMIEWQHFTDTHRLWPS